MQQPLDSGDQLAMAFPIALTGDVRAVVAAMPISRLQPAAPFAVNVRGQEVFIPYRLYNDEPSADVVASLPAGRQTILHCMYTRHHDGRVRQRHLECVAGSPEPWVVPYVVQLVGEYVLEILVTIRETLRDLDTPGTTHGVAYGQFIVDNPDFFARTQRRVVSYWSCYHRSGYAEFRGYPGCTLLDLLRAAASDRAGHPWPSLASR